MLNESCPCMNTPLYFYFTTFSGEFTKFTLPQNDLFMIANVI